ncbi:MAG: hypothetical protein R3B57_10105 [Phycisphaerales bacterium]
MSVRGALERAWRAYCLYGSGHAVGDARLREAADLIAGSQGERLAVELNPDECASPDDGDGLDARLKARNIGRVTLATHATADDLTALFNLLRTPDLSNPDRFAAEVRRRTEDRVVLEPVRYSMLSVGGHGAPDAGDGPLRWRRIHDVLTGPRDVRAAADALAQELAGEDAAQACTLLRTRLQELHEAEQTSDLEYIRSVLAAMPREACERLVWPDESERALPLEAIADLADALPVDVVCDALSLMEGSPDRFCSASALLFKRLATLAAGDAESIDRVGSLAQRWANAGPRYSDHARTISSIAALCSQASAHDFTPEDYERQLRAISTDSNASRVRNRLAWEARVEERSHADDVLLGLVERGGAPPESLSGIFAALARAIPYAAECGRTGFLARALTVGEDLDPAAPASARAGVQDLLQIASDPDVIVLALSRTDAPEDRGDTTNILLNRPGVDAAGILLRAFAMCDWQETRDWIADELSARTGDLARRLGEIIERDPPMVGALAVLIDSLPADSAFQVLGPAILNAPTTLHRIQAYSTAYRLRHPWPRDLCHRALTDNDARIRRLAAAYIKRRSADDAIDLLTQRALHRLGGVKPTPAECAALIGVFAEVRTPAADRALVHGLLYASWRIGRGRADVGRRIAAALRGRPYTRACVLARIAWALSPNRLIPTRSARRRHDD